MSVRNIIGLGVGVMLVYVWVEYMLCVSGVCVDGWGL